MVEGGAEEMFGPMPAKVVKYDAAKQLAELQPLTMVVIDGKASKLDTAKDIPVQWLSAQSFALTAPLVRGDLGWIFPAGADIGAWIAGAVENNPEPDHWGRFDLSDLIFVPGGRPIPLALPAEAYSDQGPVLWAQSVLFLGDSTAQHFVALGSPVWDELVKVDGHTHDAGGLVAPSGGGAVTGATGASSYTAPGSADDIQAAKVKAK